MKEIYAFMSVSSVLFKNKISSSVSVPTRSLGAEGVGSYVKELQAKFLTCDSVAARQAEASAGDDEEEKGDDGAETAAAASLAS
eukprot:scaffold8011_cov25-Prasinocladus_malaysianus.AAC.1